MRYHHILSLGLIKALQYRYPVSFPKYQKIDRKGLSKVYIQETSTHTQVLADAFRDWGKLINHSHKCKWVYLAY